MFRKLITCRPVAADAYADKSSAAALALSLVHGMHDAFADPVQITARFPEPFKLCRKTVLNVLFSQPPLSG